MNAKLVVGMMVASMALGTPVFAAEHAQPVRQGSFVEVTDAAAEGYVIESFAVSDDGNKAVVVTRQADYSAWAVRLVNLDGSGEMLLASHPWGAPRPWFAPRNL